MRYVYFLLSLVILLQGCTVYRKTAIPLEVAARETTRVKVETIDGQTWKFRYVQQKDDGFYGVQKVSGEQVPIRLDEGEVKAVYPRNKKIASLLTRTLIAVPVTILLFDYMNNNLSWTQ